MFNGKMIGKKTDKNKISFRVQDIEASIFHDNLILTGSVDTVCANLKELENRMIKRGCRDITISYFDGYEYYPISVFVDFIQDETDEEYEKRMANQDRLKEQAEKRKRTAEKKKKEREDLKRKEDITQLKKLAAKYPDAI